MGGLTKNQHHNLMDPMVSRVFASTNDARNRGDRFGARNSGFESAYAHRPGFGDSYDVPPGVGVLSGWNGRLILRTYLVSW